MALVMTACAVLVVVWCSGPAPWRASVGDPPARDVSAGREPGDREAAALRLGDREVAAAGRRDLVRLTVRARFVDGKPAHGASVRVTTNASVIEGETDADGEVVVELPASSSALCEATYQGLATKAAPVDCPRDCTLDLVFDSGLWPVFVRTPAICNFHIQAKRRNQVRPGPFRQVLSYMADAADVLGPRGVYVFHLVDGTYDFTIQVQKKEIEVIRLDGIDVRQETHLAFEPRGPTVEEPPVRVFVLDAATGATVPEVTLWDADDRLLGAKNETPVELSPKEAATVRYWRAQGYDEFATPEHDGLARQASPTIRLRQSAAVVVFVEVRHLPDQEAGSTVEVEYKPWGAARWSTAGAMEVLGSARPLSLHPSAYRFQVRREAEVLGRYSAEVRSGLEGQRIVLGTVEADPDPSPSSGVLELVGLPNWTGDSLEIRGRREDRLLLRDTDGSGSFTVPVDGDTGYLQLAGTTQLYVDGLVGRAQVVFPQEAQQFGPTLLWCGTTPLGDRAGLVVVARDRIAGFLRANSSWPGFCITSSSSGIVVGDGPAHAGVPLAVTWPNGTPVDRYSLEALVGGRRLFLYRLKRGEVCRLQQLPDPREFVIEACALRGTEVARGVIRQDGATAVAALR